MPKACVCVSHAIVWLVQVLIGILKACHMQATSDNMKPSQPCERASCPGTQVAYTLADRVLTPANQQVKVLDVKEARPARAERLSMA